MKKTKQKKSRLEQYDAKSQHEDLNISEPCRYAAFFRSVLNGLPATFLTLYRPRPLLCLQLIATILLFSSVALAQSAGERAAAGVNEIKSLQAGERVSDEFWRAQYLLYVDGDSVRRSLEEYRGRPIILDFWAQWCSPCIASLQKVNKYIGRLGSSGTFLPVTSDKYTAAADVWKKQDFILPTVIEDKRLSSTFPHTTIPHVVWIDANGTVRYISNQEQLTEINVTDFFAGKDLDMMQKTYIDKDRPLLLNDKVSAKDVSHYELIINGRQDYLPMLKFSRNTVQGIYSRTYINTPLINIYKGLAYDLFYQMGQTVFDQDFRIVDTSLLTDIYTLDIIAAFENQSSFNRHILQILNASSGLKAEIISEPRACLVLKSIDAKVHIGTSGGAKIREVDWDEVIRLQNIPMSFFQGILMDERMTGKYIVNDTGYKGNIDIQLAVTDDLLVLNRQLDRYGLVLEPEVRDVNIFTITKSSTHESL